MKTITFYSYKGGTGRTLAVANAAKFLARFPNVTVFVLDFDLEAPGLHYKFGVPPQEGVVDFIHRFTHTGRIPDVRLYCQEIRLPVECKGSLHFMAAGKAPEPEYSSTLTNCGLADLFRTERQGTAIAVDFFLELKARIESEFNPDFLLIDSRTGLTEIGGVAVRLLADKVVCLVQSNPENLAGARAVLRDLKSNSPVDITFFVVLARVPEQRLDEEQKLVSNTRAEFNKDNPDDPLVDNILLLHSEPMLQTEETLLIDTKVTPNESALLRDYYKLFQRLELDHVIKDRSASSVVTAIADPDEKIRSLALSQRNVNGREWAGHERETLGRIRARPRPAMKVVPAVYLTGKMYHLLIDGVRAQLRRRFRLQKDDTMKPEDVRWDLLAVHLEEGVVDFCNDAIYLTNNRARFSEVVQLGWCSTFTGFVRVDSPVYPELSKIQSPDFDIKNFADEVKRLIRQKRFQRLAVGVLGDTPAASDAANRFLSPILDTRNLVSWDTEKQLLKWLEKGTPKQPRIAVCDWVVADKLTQEWRKLTRARGACRYSSVPRIKFARSIPVGVVYPREASNWRTSLAQALAYSVTNILKAGTTRRWTKLCDEFKKNGLELLALEDLRCSLLLDFPFEEAVRWNAAFEEALTGESKLAENEV